MTLKGRAAVDRHCNKCGHSETILAAVGTFFGSAADFCTKCDEPWDGSDPYYPVQTQVTVRDTPFGRVRHLTIDRLDGEDGISWDDLQRAKNEMLGPEVCCVEFYPPAGRVVNEINRRHLWECPEGWLPL